MPILVEHCGSKDEFTMKTAINWIKDFVDLGERTLPPPPPGSFLTFRGRLLSRCFGGILHTLIFDG